MGRKRTPQRKRLLGASWCALGVDQRKRPTPSASLEDGGLQRDVVDGSPSYVVASLYRRSRRRRD